ncbi:MAG: ArsR family transcriptional regulator [Deltaproteobacteria bacterium]|nr:MAG: ArsR family transcriptional regulator [Deltaproteobacteria bacterium]
MRTVRQQIIQLLINEEMCAREISQTLRIREKEVYDHLSHIARTVATQQMRLVVQPFRCLACGYLFQNRKRFTRPSRCPRCKRSYVQEPTYQIC